LVGDEGLRNRSKEGRRGGERRGEASQAEKTRESHPKKFAPASVIGSNQIK
jgi:hypothetical protein